jgi:hypothetical protein
MVVHANSASSFSSLCIVLISRTKRDKDLDISFAMFAHSISHNVRDLIYCKRPEAIKQTIEVMLSNLVETLEQFYGKSGFSAHILQVVRGSTIDDAYVESVYCFWYPCNDSTTLSRGSENSRMVKTDTELVKIANGQRFFMSGDVRLHALKNPSFSNLRGEHVPKGYKSTLVVPIRSKSNDTCQENKIKGFLCIDMPKRICAFDHEAKQVIKGKLRSLPVMGKGVALEYSLMLADALYTLFDHWNPAREEQRHGGIPLPVDRK